MEKFVMRCDFLIAVMRASRIVFAIAK